jgi:hypothetical protein
MVCFPNRFDFFSSSSFTLVIIVGIVVILVIWSHKTSPNIIVLPSASNGQGQSQSQAQAPIRVNIRNLGRGDDRYTRAPEPERDWDTPPDYSRIPNPDRPFNIPTQGIPEQYQSMGIVKTSDGKLLPLFGRRSISARERYNYYTRTDSYNPLPIPIEMQGRDCQDQVGCPELYNGDKVKMSATNDICEVTIYKVRDIVR